LAREYIGKYLINKGKLLLKVCCIDKFLVDPAHKFKSFGQDLYRLEKKKGKVIEVNELSLYATEMKFQLLTLPKSKPTLFCFQGIVSELLPLTSPGSTLPDPFPHFFYPPQSLLLFLDPHPFVCLLSILVFTVDYCQSVTADILSGPIRLALFDIILLLQWYTSLCTPL